MPNVKRCPVRFRDEDCPEGVADIFDHPQYGDRYTVFYRQSFDGWVDYRGMSESPSSPQGVGISAQMRSYEFSAYRQANRRKRVAWSTLPDAVKRCVIADLSMEVTVS